MSDSPASGKRITRRGFLLSGAGAISALGAYTVGGVVVDASYQPPRFESEPQPEADRRGTPAQPIAILIDAGAEVSFGYYLGEILRAEGLNAFQLERLDGIDAAYLRGFPLVVLPPARLALEQTRALRSYVSEGGSLIAMRPAPDLAPLFGVEYSDGATQRGYLAAREGDGTPLQIHAEAGHYTPNGATVIADLYADRATPTGFAAVAAADTGKGRAAMFAYDLAYNIALTRQGNPAWANAERDGADGVRANDLFVDWIDLDNVHVPQADVQARLLVSLIEDALRDRMPIPRLWYFPGAARSLIVVTGDAHAMPSASIEDTFGTLEAFGGCGTVYYSPPADAGMKDKLLRSLSRLPLLDALAPGRSGRPTPEAVAAWRARGHEFGVHPYVEDGVEAGYVTYLRAFHRDGYDPASPTVRTHRILWNGWVETARVQAEYGFRMNVDYYHIGPAFRAADGSWPAGHFIGSGLPMKFVDERGALIDVFQQPTQLVDEHWLATTNRGWVGLNGEQAAQVARELIDQCIAGAYAALTVQYHMDFESAEGPDYQNAHRWLTGILSYAREKQLPVWSAEHWLAFTQARHEAEVADVQWDQATATLSFALSLRQDADDPVSVMLPAAFDGRALRDVRIDEQPVDVQHEGRYALAAASTGAHRVQARYQAGAGRVTARRVTTT